MQRRFSKKFQDMEKSSRVRLELLDAATSLKDLDLPGLRRRPSKAIERDSTASGLTTSTASVLSGATGTLMTSRLWTTIRRQEYGQ